MTDLSQPTSAVEIIAEALDGYDEPYARMVERPGAGDVAAQLLATWEKHLRMEPIIENVYATGGDAAIKGSLLFDVLTALHAQSDRTANLAQAYERIGERLVRATREYIFRVHAMRDADEAERLLAQRRREYQRELTMRRAYE